MTQNQQNLRISINAVQQHLSEVLKEHPSKFKYPYLDTHGQDKVMEQLLWLNEHKQKAYSRFMELQEELILLGLYNEEKTTFVSKEEDDEDIDSSPTGIET